MTSLLSASPPDFTGVVTSPSADASVAANGSRDGAWTGEPRADYEIAEVSKRLADAGPPSWGLTYASTRPESPDSTRVHIGGDGDAGPDAGSPIPGVGTYLINVFYTKAHCPPSKDGCVYASSVAETIVTAHQR